MVRLTGGQALVAQLRREGVETIFGLPGVQLDWAFDALYAHRDHIRVVHTRHEQACSYMADGYARTTGKVGACLVVPGPGLLNATAGLSTAYACSSPVLCISGQIQSDLIGVGRGLLHEINDQLEMIGSVTKWAARAMSPAEVPGIVREAFRQLRTGRSRPVEIEIPPDILQAEGDVELLDPLPIERSAGDPDLLAQAATLLRSARHPLIFAGGGVFGAEAWDEVRQLAESLQAPVVMTRNGRGVLSDRHYLALNSIAGRRLLPEADVVLAVGTRFVESVQWGLPPAANVIHVDVDEAEVGRNFRPAVGVVGDAKLALTRILEQVDGAARPSREAELTVLKNEVSDLLFEIQPQAAYAEALRAALPADGILINESTQVGYFSNVGFPVYEPRTMITSGYQGTLGYGFATALGAQVGNPDKKVLSINGDGGFMYNVQELSTMKAHGINLVTVVFNDNAFGNVKRIQQETFNGRTIASDLYNPDFVRLAESFGIAGMRARTPDELEGSLREAFASNQPVLIEAPVSQMPGMWHLLMPSAPKRS